MVLKGELEGCQALELDIKRLPEALPWTWLRCPRLQFLIIHAEPDGNSHWPFLGDISMKWPALRWFLWHRYPHDTIDWGRLSNLVYIRLENAEIKVMLPIFRKIYI